MNEDTLGYVTLSQLDRVLDSVRKHSDEFGIDDPIISFEFLIGSLYPMVLKNIKDTIAEQFTLGYIAGSKAAEEGAIDDPPKILN